MMKQHNLIYQLLNLFWKYCLVTGYWLGLNFLLVICFFFLKLTLLTFPLYFLLLSQALTSTFVLTNLLADKSWSTGFKSGWAKIRALYHQQFKFFFALSLCYEVLLSFILLELDQIATHPQLQLLAPVLLILLLLVVLSYFWSLAIQSYFWVTLKENIKLALAALTHYPLTTLSLIFVLFLAYLALKLIPQYVIWVLIPLMLTATMKLTYPALGKLKKLVVIRHG